MPPTPEHLEDMEQTTNNWLSDELAVWWIYWQSTEDIGIRDACVGLPFPVLPFGKEVWALTCRTQPDLNFTVIPVSLPTFDFSFRKSNYSIPCIFIFHHSFAHFWCINDGTIGKNKLSVAYCKCIAHMAAALADTNRSNILGFSYPKWRIPPLLF